MTGNVPFAVITWVTVRPGSCATTKLTCAVRMPSSSAAPDSEAIREGELTITGFAATAGAAALRPAMTQTAVVASVVRAMCVLVGAALPGLRH